MEPGKEPLNPYAPPASVGAISVPQVDESMLGPVVEQQSVSGKTAFAQWDLKFHREHLAATRGDGVRLVLSRDELVRGTDLLLGVFMKSLAVRVGTKAIIGMPPHALAALRRFVDPVLEEHLAASLKRRVRLAWPIGVLVLVTSLPAFSLGLDVGGLIFGAGLILLAIGARLARHRALFLFDAALWLVLAANNARHLADGGSHAMFVLFAGLGVLFSVGSAKLYGFYAPVRG